MKKSYMKKEKKDSLSLMKNKLASLQDENKWLAIKLELIKKNVI